MKYTCELSIAKGFVFLSICPEMYTVQPGRTPLAVQDYGRGTTACMHWMEWIQLGNFLKQCHTVKIDGLRMKINISLGEQHLVGWRHALQDSFHQICRYSLSKPITHGKFLEGNVLPKSW